jgi:hypothetical protein
MITVTADVPEDSVSSAAFGLGLDIAHVSRSGVLRAALAMFHGKSKPEARELAISGKSARLGSDGQDLLSGQVPEDLADVGDIQRAHAIRIGLAMSAGMTRKQAESWSRMQIRPAGRPQGSQDRKPRKPRSKTQ